MTEIFAKIKNAPMGALILAVAMVLTVASFFVQSALPPEASSAESDAVSDAIEPIIPSDTPVGEFVHPNIRKIGHFAEFGLLGLEAALLVFFYSKRKAIGALRSFVCAQFIALADETVQIFSGRGPEISDVWIDIFGFSTLFVITVCAAYAARTVMKKIRNRINGKNNRR